jgi:F-type H+-transporting ATPase subunit a
MRDHGSGEMVSIIRPGNADLNGTIALALVSFVAWFYFIMRYAGPALVFKDIFGNKADKKEIPALIYYPLFLVFGAVGLIEIISIVFRPISLSFRLFGNVYGGENLLHAMSAMSRWGLPIPFYFLELLIGFVQALVFTLLVSVYIGLICNHGDDHAEEHGHGQAAH